MIERNMQFSSAAAVAVLYFVVNSCMFADLGVNASRAGNDSCMAILVDNLNASSGDYSLITSTGKILPRVYCEMGLNGGGYTFLHPADVKQMTNEEVQAMFTDRTSFLLRVRLTNGTQPFGVLKQFPADSSEPLSLFLNSNPGYNSPANSEPIHLGDNYMYYGFQPMPIPTGSTQGLIVNDEPLSFVNCNGHPNSYFALFPNNDEASTAYVTDASFSWLYSSILSALKLNPSMRVMPDDYFMFFEGNQGGCGMYVQSDAQQARYPQPDLAGNENVFVISMAIGFR